MATIPFNLLFSLFVGACFTACARTQLLIGAQPLRQPDLSMVLSYALLTVAPVASYLYLAYPDWSWMYLVEPHRLTPGTGLAVVVLTMLMVPAGYLLGWLVLRVVRERGLFAVLGALAMALGLLLGLAHRRMFYMGHFEDFRAGGLLLRPITQGKLIFALLCTGPVMLIAAGSVGWSLWGQGRWLRQQAASVSLRSGDHVAGPPGKATGRQALRQRPAAPRSPDEPGRPATPSTQPDLRRGEGAYPGSGST